MLLYFDRPVGAAADLSELEYISALLQTQEKSLRADGSLTAKDVHLYLKSRHAIDFPVEDVEKYIIEQLAGTVIEDNEMSAETESENVNKIQSIAKRELKIDIVQLTSLLLIPLFREYDKTSLPEEKRTALLSKSSPPKAKSVKVDGTDCFDCKNSSYAPVDQEFSEETKEEIQLGEGNSSCSETNENEGKSDLKRRNNHSMGFLEANKSDEAEEKDRNFMMDAEKPADLIDLVLSIILQESKLQHGTEINPGVIQEILIIFREDFPDEMVDGMIKACGDNPKLNRDTLLKALTHDIAAYDLSRHQKLSTHYEDACKAVTDSKNRDRLDRFWTASNIDVTADTFGSMAWTILGMLTYVTIVYRTLVLAILFILNNRDIAICSPGFFCETFKVCVITSMSTLVFGLSDSLFTFFTTLGNSVYIYGSHGGVTKSSENIPGTGIYERILPRIGSFVYGVLLLCLGIVVTAAVLYSYFEIGKEYSSQNKDHEERLNWLGICLCSLLLVTQVVQLIRAAIPSRYYENYVNGSIMASGTIRAELRQKHACIFKVNKMVKNAAACYNPNAAESAICTEGEDSKSMYNFAKSSVDGLDFYRSAVSDALLRFAMTEDERERSGGILWIMKKILDGTIYTEEGVWLFPRMVAANILQWVVVVIFIILTVILLEEVKKNEANPETRDFVKKNQAYIAVLFGGFLAIVSATNFAIDYIASGYASVLKLRSGFLPSLKDCSWPAKRKNIYTICLLVPAAFFASLLSGIINGALASFLVIVLSSQHPAVRDVFDPLLAGCLGAVVVFLIKLAVFQTSRINGYGAFMRRFPAYANLYNTFQDAWNIGLATFSIFMRLGKLLCIFLLYIGRFDKPLLHPGVGLLFSEHASVEVLSPAFEKSLLLHEAHRHPYIEQIGYMYLLKIGCREDFGTQVGAAWRILFTLALFPWLRKYRLNEFHRKVLGTHQGDDIQKLKAHTLELEKKLEAARKVLAKQVKVGRSVILRNDGKQDTPTPT